MASKEYYIKKLEEAIEQQDPLLIQNLITELNALSASEKKPLKALYAKIEEDLFTIDLEPPMNYDLQNFVLAASVNSVGGKIAKGKHTGGNGVKKQVKDINEVFIKFYNTSQEIFTDLKYHFLFHLNNPSYEEVGLLILTDEGLKDNPLVERIVKDNRDITPQKFSTSEFLDMVKKRPELLESQYLVLFVTSPTYGDASNLRRQLEELFSNFEKGSIIKVRNKVVSTTDDYIYGSPDNQLYDQIAKITSNFLNNKAITHEEEKIIKIALSSNTAITDYKILKAGFSGAKVIEVKPIRYSVNQTPIRFVIKFAEKTKESKLYLESEAFKRCVQEFKIPDYTCEYIDTVQYEAIKYNYASSDSIIDSHSFANLIDDSLTDTPKHSHNLRECISELFECPILSKWSAVEIRAKSIEEIYNRYLVDNKILVWISKLEGENNEKIKSSDFWKKFSRILKHIIEYKEKICHGDLHSENFFKDKHDVYLIDFGYTSENHAVIDHSTLEASIKFKHIPAYIPYSELIEVEKQCLSPDSFSTSFDFSFINRPQLRKLYELIALIRQKAAQDLTHSSNHLDYLISLFIITVRQIQYKDLNQRYAWESAKLLANHIDVLL